VNYEIFIKKGFLDDFKYLHENGCPWTKQTCKKASKYGQLKIFEIFT